MLRRYAQKDCAEVVNVWELATAVAHDFLSEEFQQQERYNISTVYLPQAETWVWDEKGKVVGFIALLGNEIGGLFVNPAFQRSGIGKNLVSKALALKGDVEVEVFENNLLGRNFYLGMGFEPLCKKFHEKAGFEVLRLHLRANKVSGHTD
jgi:putative acetyltransferase